MTFHVSNLSRRRAMVAGALAAAGAAISLPALAQATYPAKPIKLMVGYAPGGAVDMVTRVVADMLSAQLGGTVVVENIPGAAGVVGAQRAASSPADGYTLLLGSSNELAATGLVNPAQKYDPLKDFVPLGLVATSPVLLVAGPKVPVKTIDEFVAMVKSQPGKYSYGTSGVGSTLHFAGEMIKQQAGLFMTHIPYRTSGAMISDLAGGTLEFGMITPAAAVPLIKAGRMVPLGITSVQRFPALPQVPALRETAQFKGFELTGWFGLVAPKGVPADVAQRISEALKAGVADPTFRRRLEEGGAVPAATNEDLATVMRGDLAKYSNLVKFANMRD